MNQSFPTIRLRRNRQNQWIRNLVAETNLIPSDLILPIFIIEGKSKKEKIPNLPDIFRLSIDLAIKEIKLAKTLGIQAIMLFPVVDQKLKTKDAKEATNSKNLICRAIHKIKNEIPEIGIIADVALDPYTIDGHDGISDKNGYVLNDETIEKLTLQAIVQSEAGCDVIAPSDMMDGRIIKIREALDVNNFQNILIFSYAAKYASNFYGPFRNAVGSISNLKKSDKKTYQMDYRNSKESIREIELDILEGADSIIIKPAISYLDIIYQSANKFNLPIIAYQVSGEYAMLKYGAKEGIFNFEEALIENIISIKRAGAKNIITYAALEIAKNQLC